MDKARKVVTGELLNGYKRRFVKDLRNILGTRPLLAQRPPNIISALWIAFGYQRTNAI
ncbi:hypothetical protein J6590_003731 [Homalodisca vitripennis]|nr:hypothetical protein J6590_003731 [Homalodisca vitripennis]